jgi:hypothetical protein
MTWNMVNVKEQLPDIKVRDGKNVLPAVLRGRELPFPVVCWGDRLQYKAEVCWETVLHCLNSNLPVIV